MLVLKLSKPSKLRLEKKGRTGWTEPSETNFESKPQRRKKMSHRHPVQPPQFSVVETFSDHAYFMLLLQFFNWRRKNLVHNYMTYGILAIHPWQMTRFWTHFLAPIQNYELWHVCPFKKNLKIPFNGIQWGRWLCVRSVNNQLTNDP